MDRTLASAGGGALADFLAKAGDPRRLVLPTGPAPADISLVDLFDIEQLQRIQDAFAKATRVASIITHPNGVPVTKPSNFCRLCQDVIRKTAKGEANCMCSDAVIGRQNPGGPTVQTCLSGGLWDAGASITVGGRPIGNWLVGQVRSERSGEDRLVRYAQEIGADEAEFREALREVPVMSPEQFRDIADLGFILAKELSLEAYYNLQQSRHIVERKAAEAVLRDSTNRLKLLLEINNAVVSKLDHPHLLKLIPARVREAMGCDAVSLWLPDAELTGFTVRGLDFPDGKGILTEDAVLAAADGCDPFARNDAFENPLAPAEARRIAEGEAFCSECFIPVVMGAERLALLHLADRHPHRFTAHDVDFLTQAAGQVAIALDNANKYSQLRRSRERLAAENLYLAHEISADQQFDRIIGESAAFRRVLDHVSIVAGTDSTVLITGETGTGKELIARAIHENSPRRQRMFIKVNCAAIPAGLLESELFGHEKGAFTGAVARKLGRFEVANGGTLFLDEVGDIPPDLQSKLLRVLQEQEFERVGGATSIRVDVRVVSATNRHLEQMMCDGSFRPDLFYRLNVFPIALPSLRDRPEDIPPLVEHYVAKYTRKMNRAVEVIPGEVMDQLVRYAWPGNVRELVNLVQRAVILSPGHRLISPLAELTEARRPAPRPLADRRSTLVQMERDHIEQVLKETGWVLGGSRGAAARLGIPRTTLIYKMRRLSIPRQQ